MRYAQFRASVREYLGQPPGRATWAELRQELSLPYRPRRYRRINRMEDETGSRQVRCAVGMGWTIARWKREGYRA